MRRALLETPADHLRRRAARSPNGPALEWDGGSATWRELHERAEGVAARLGAVVGGRAATIHATPGMEAVAALFGVWRAGGVAVPLHERLTPREVAAARRIVDPALHIDDDLARELARDAPGSRPQRPSAAGDPHRNAAPHRHRGPATIAFILTSGSTGRSRAIGFSHANFAASAASVASRLRLAPADRWGLCLSTGHIGGLSLVVRAVLLGAPVRLWPAFDPDGVATAIARGEVTHLAVVPVMLRRLVARLRDASIPPTLRCVLVGGAAASPGLLRDAWTAGLPLATTWGMTETTSQIATAPPSLARRFPGTAGRPLRRIQVRSDANGVLQVRGPTLAASVVATPGARPQPLPADSSGWFATRDLGRVDEGGRVWIEGRADATIVSGGLNVSPAEIERVIAMAPGVRDAVVFGVPDEEWGEVVAAVVEADPGMVDAARIDEHCRARLSRGRCPTRIVVVDALKRTWTGKVIRPRARDLLETQPASNARPAAPHARPAPNRVAP